MTITQFTGRFLASLALLSTLALFAAPAIASVTDPTPEEVAIYLYSVNPIYSTGSVPVFDPNTFMVEPTEYVSCDTITSCRQLYVDYLVGYSNYLEGVGSLGNYTTQTSEYMTLSPDEFQALYDAYILGDVTADTTDQTVVTITTLPTAPEIPDDPLDMKYKDYVALLEYSLDLLQEKVDSGTLTVEQIATYSKLITAVTTVLDSMKEEDQEAYVNPLGRFGVKSTINSLTTNVGITGGYFEAGTDAEEILAGSIVRIDPLNPDLYNAAYALYNDGDVVQSGVFSSITEYDIKSVIGSSLTDFLTGHQGFYYPEGVAPTLVESLISDSDPCALPFSIADLETEVNEIADVTLNYDLDADSASGTLREASYDFIVNYFDSSTFTETCTTDTTIIAPTDLIIDPTVVDTTTADLVTTTLINNILDTTTTDATNCVADIPICMADPDWEDRH